MGATGGMTGSGMTGSGTTGSGTSMLPGQHGHHNRGEDIVHGGAHHTETANRLDPHVSSGSTTGSGLGGMTSGSGMGSSGMGSSTTGTGYGSSTTGSGYGDSTTGRSGMTGSGMGTTGSSTTAGPHSSNLMNKAVSFNQKILFLDMSCTNHMLCRILALTPILTVTGTWVLA